MPTTASDQETLVPIAQVEQELMRRLHAVQKPGEAPALRACMSNLVIFCDRQELAQTVAAEIPAVVALHPARVLLVIGEPNAGEQNPSAKICVRSHPAGQGRRIYAEQVTLHAHGQAAMERLPFVVRGLLIGDLPVNLWWATPSPPPLGGSLLHELSERAQQVVYDSIGWSEPARGVMATATWLNQMSEEMQPGRWRVAADLNWRRLKYWRRLLAQALDPASAPGALDSISGVLVEHGPHAVIQAWELVSWLAARLGWQVEAGGVQPGVEIDWQLAAPHGRVNVRIRRLDHGPSEVQRVQVECHLAGKEGAIDVRVAEEGRLAAVLEGVDAAPRTLTAPPQPLAELVGRQLSDRERDSLFLSSMSVAQVLAQRVTSSHQT